MNILEPLKWRCLRKDSAQGLSYSNPIMDSQIGDNEGKQTRPWGYWRIKENVIKEAQKYQRRGDFSKYAKGAYESALRNGWIEGSIAHMPPPVLGRKGNG